MGKNIYAGTKTEKNLLEAFAGESQARNKYTYFASVAKKAGYVPQRLYNRDEKLRRCLDALRTGFRDGVSYEDLYQRLLFGAGGSPADEYLLLADFASYREASKRMAETYGDSAKWNRMSLHNIARSGIFAADRSVAEYADNIWHVEHR